MGDIDLLSLVLRLVFGVLIIWAVYHFLFKRDVVFVVRLRQGRLTHRGAFSLYQKATLAQVLLLDLGLRGPIKIIGHRVGKRLSLEIRGRLSEGEKQRIRNVLLVQV
jgi:hypothetical protein